MYNSITIQNTVFSMVYYAHSAKLDQAVVCIHIPED